MSRTGRIIRHLIPVLALALLLLIAYGCGPSGGAGKEAKPTGTCAPTNLTVKPNDHSMFLSWDVNCPEEVLLSGYSVYISPFSLAEYKNKALPDSITPYNNAPYPGDTNPDDGVETMEITNLENGVPYYVSVRTVFPDQTESAASNEVLVYCRPEGEFTLDMRFTGDHDGFDFSDGQYVRADGSDNDIYYYRAGTTDFIASPHRLNGYIRKSWFYSLGKTKDIYQYPELEIDDQPVNKMPIREGESYLVKTADGNFAKIRVEKITGENRDRKVDFKYIYQPTPDLMRF